MAESNQTSQNSLLKLDGVVKYFPGVRANDGIDIEVNRGEVLALLGENGAGKTTLMRCLVGLYHLDAGHIYWKGEEVSIHSPAKASELGIGMVHQQFSLIPTFTVAESVALGSYHNRKFKLDLDTTKKEIQDLADSYGFYIHPDVRIDELSMGARQRVEILKILYRNAELLVLDEPTSVLTPQEVQDLFRVVHQIVSKGRSVVFISHKLDEVMEISDRITVLRDGKVVGNLPVKEATPKKLSTLMVGREVLFDFKKKELSKGEPVLQVNNISVSNEGIAQLKNVTFQVSSGEILGIAGIAGNGQDKLVQTIAGLLKTDSGTISIDDNDLTNTSPQRIKECGLSYMPADRRGTGLVLSMNINENFLLRDYNAPQFSNNGFIKHNAVQQFTNDLIKSFNIRVASQKVSVGTLSGGNQQKVVAAREISRDPKVLIAEQPTMGLDVSATEYVRSRLLEERDQGTAVLLVSTELNEVLSISDRVLVMFRGEIMGEIIPGQVSIETIGLLMAGQKLESIKDEAEK